MLFIGRQEDDGRHSVDTRRIDNSEAVHSGHFDIQEDELGAGVLDCLDGLETVGALTGDLGTQVAVEQVAHPLACRRLVRDDQNANLPLVCRG
jgi:hypothetical protein